MPSWQPPPNQKQFDFHQWPLDWNVCSCVLNYRSCVDVSCNFGGPWTTRAKWNNHVWSRPDFSSWFYWR
jgi:hypothetical protein